MVSTRRQRSRFELLLGIFAEHLFAHFSGGFAAVFDMKHIWRSIRKHQAQLKDAFTEGYKVGSTDRDVERDAHREN